VDALWLSPHFPSPQADCGYDISDYTGVAPEYGTLDDFQRFLDGAHRRGLRVILDLVLNHSSDQHPWFLESRSHRDNPKRDWYVWRDGRNGGPPNNWYSGFGGSAWEYVPATGQYYYHYFLKEQPDLNWHNPEMKQAMWQAARFWLDRGVDGFRLDAIGTIFENPALPDHNSEMTLEALQRAYRASYPNQPDAKTQAHLARQIRLLMAGQLEQPGVHALMQELRAVVDEYPDRMLVGENEDITYYGDGTNELHLAFNFPLMRTDRLTPAWVRANQRERLAALPAGAWPCNTLGNHDSPRVWSRYGSGHAAHDAALARLALALMLTLRGTPFLYNGEEIGMTDLLLEEVSQVRDTWALWLYHAEVGHGTSLAEATAIAARFSRDKCRTPMQWANAPNAGFSPAGESTWLPVNPNHAQGVNVADQQDDANSLLNFYRRMLRVRRQTPALLAGDYQPLHETAEDYLAFLRQSDADRQTCLVVLNMSDRSPSVNLALASHSARCLFSTHRPAGETQDLSALKLAPFEVYISELEAKP
jgi:alpha-glucosidase